MKQEISIRPSTIQDREKIFRWLTQSNLTIDMIGAPNYPDHPIPSWEYFIQDYKDHYFDGSESINGRCFIIQLGDIDIGQINYNRIDESQKSTDIDIWLSDKKFVGKGNGRAAIKLLADHLKKDYSCKKLFVSPSKRNVNAIKAYEKAGFKITGIIPDKSNMDYMDNILLEKNL